MSAITRFIQYYRQFGTVNILRKLLFRLLREIDGLFIFFRRCRFYFRTKCWIRGIGRDVVIKGIGNHIYFGYITYLYDKVIIEISEHARLKVGNHFTLSYGGLIACHHSIEIGDYVMIGEYTSIRDTSHNYSTEGVVFMEQRDVSQPIKIGNNVWIGRGCIIFPGTIIEDGVIVGANSIVKGHLRSNSIYAGAPLKLVSQIYTRDEAGNAPALL